MILNDHDKEMLVQTHLKHAADTFSDLAGRLGIHGLTVSSGASVVVSTPDPEAMTREFGSLTVSPDGWVEKAAAQMGGKLS